MKITKDGAILIDDCVITDEGEKKTTRKFI